MLVESFWGERNHITNDFFAITLSFVLSYRVCADFGSSFYHAALLRIHFYGIKGGRKLANIIKAAYTAIVSEILSLVEGLLHTTVLGLSVSYW